MNGDLFSWKGLIHVTFTKSLWPLFQDLKVVKGLILCNEISVQ